MALLEVKEVENDRGEGYVTSKMNDDSWPTKVVDKLWDRLELLEKYGLQHMVQKTKMVKSVPGSGKGKMKIYEVKYESLNVAYRIYFTVKSGICWLLTAFTKSKRKNPSKEMSVAINRANRIK